MAEINPVIHPVRTGVIAGYSQRLGADIDRHNLCLGQQAGQPDGDRTASRADVRHPHPALQPGRRLTDKRFRIEPGERGSGVVYQSNVAVNSIQQKYQNEVERTIPEALKQGIKGWEVTDIIITLIEGEDHVLHSRPGDFVVATPMGIMNGLVNTGTRLLEPIIRFKIDASEDLLGIITSDITRMRGSFDSPLIENGRLTLTGLFPLATSLDYPVRLSSRSGGKARISTTFHGYDECTDEQGVIRPFRGISPLDIAKYILKARKALG